MGSLAIAFTAVLALMLASSLTLSSPPINHGDLSTLVGILRGIGISDACVASALDTCVSTSQDGQSTPRVPPDDSSPVLKLLFNLGFSDACVATKLDACAGASQEDPTQTLLKEARALLQETRDLLLQGRDLQQERNFHQQTKDTLQETRNSLQATEGLLQKEKNNHQQTKDTLQETRNSLQATEGLLQKEKSNHQQTKDTLQETRNSLQATEGLLQEERNNHQQTEDTLQETRNSLQATEGLLQKEKNSLQQTEEALQEESKSHDETKRLLQVERHLHQEAKDLLERVAPCVNKIRENARHCKDLLDAGDRESGVREIKPYLDPAQPERRLRVYCDQSTDGGGWTVFQRRTVTTNREDFYRRFAEYEEGFGDVEEEFWLGLDALHALTSSEPQELRIDLADWEGEHRHAKYSSFKVDGPSTKYRLTVGGYNGTAGDSFSGLTGQQFTTHDSDNDRWIGGNCAELWRGAWWYGWCAHSNLNGYQYKQNPSEYGKGIWWDAWRGLDYSLRDTTMKLRTS